MTNSYQPTEETIQAHVRHVEESDVRSWSRGRSLHLLLGLRDPAVDKKLIDIARNISASDVTLSQLQPGDIIELAQNNSIHRIVRLVTQHFGLASLAWLTPIESELSELIESLRQRGAGRARRCEKSSWGRALISRVLNRRNQADYTESTALSSPVLFASLCDLVQRFGNRGSLDALGRFARNGWLEQVAWQRLCKEPPKPPRLTMDQTPPWLPELPPSLIRDPLTGLLSRSVFCSRPDRYRLETDKELPGRLPAPGAIMFDVDHMKRTNDAHGHLVGDSVLRCVAEELQQVVGDRVVRVGGDELLVLWEFGEVTAVAQTIVEAIRALEIPNPDELTKPIHVTVSAAVANGTDGVEVFRALDDSMERAKVAGRDRVEIA